MADRLALVLFGDVIASRRGSAGSKTWLRDLVTELDAAYGHDRLAPFGLTQGDEIGGLIEPEADPFVATLHAALGTGSRRMRWVAVRGEVDPDSTGTAPATERTGPALIAARQSMDAARRAHERLVVVTGHAQTDTLLASLTPALVDMLDDLTERQRTVARLALIEDLRQSEVADRLRVRRATVSVSFGRARIRSLQRFVGAVREVYRGECFDRPSAATFSRNSPSGMSEPKRVGWPGRPASRGSADWPDVRSPEDRVSRRSWNG